MTHDAHTPPLPKRARAPRRVRRSDPPTQDSARAKAGVRAATQRPAAVPGDLTAQRCQAWLNHQAEACRLSLEWGQVEARLQAEHGWYKMPTADRERHPGQAELDAIQVLLEELDVARDQLLPTLANLRATTTETVALKLAVVAEIVDIADFPEAHALIVRAREEMLAL